MVFYTFMQTPALVCLPAVSSITESETEELYWVVVSRLAIAYINVG